MIWYGTRQTRSVQGIRDPFGIDSDDISEDNRKNDNIQHRDKHVPPDAENRLLVPSFQLPVGQLGQRIPHRPRPPQFTRNSPLHGLSISLPGRGSAQITISKIDMPHLQGNQIDENGYYQARYQCLPAVQPKQDHPYEKDAHVSLNI